MAFARNSCFVIVLLALIVPGLSSSLIRQSPKPCLVYCSAILGAFLLFGPLWNDVLCPKYPTNEWGNYPFLLIYIFVVVTSILRASDDRTKASSGMVPSPADDRDLRAISDQCTECNTPVPPKTEAKP